MRALTILVALAMCGCSTEHSSSRRIDRLEHLKREFNDSVRAADWAAAEQALQRTFDVAGDDRQKLQISLHGAALGVMKQDRALGVKWARRALAIAEKRHNRQLAGDALRREGDVRSQTGDERGGARAFAKAARRYAAARRSFDEAEAHAYAGQSFFNDGNPVFRRHYLRAAALYDANGETGFAVEMRSTLASRIARFASGEACIKLVRAGRFREARRSIEAIKSDERHPLATLCLVEALVGSDRKAAARSMLEKTVRRGAVGAFCDAFQYKIDQLKSERRFAALRRPPRTVCLETSIRAAERTAG